MFEVDVIDLMNPWNSYAATSQPLCSRSVCHRYCDIRNRNVFESIGGLLCRSGEQL